MLDRHFRSMDTGLDILAEAISRWRETQRSFHAQCLITGGGGELIVAAAGHGLVVNPSRMTTPVFYRVWRPCVLCVKWVRVRRSRL